MKTIQVEFGKPSKFYVNNRRIGLNTAFGMYQKGAKFTINGKKLNLNKFGVSPSARYKIPSELVEKIILMKYGLDPHPLAKIIKDNKKWEATKRWSGDKYNWTGVQRDLVGHPGFKREDVMKLKSDEIRDIMDKLSWPYSDYSNSDNSRPARARNRRKHGIDWSCGLAGRWGCECDVSCC